MHGRTDIMPLTIHRRTHKPGAQLCRYMKIPEVILDVNAVRDSSMLDDHCVTASHVERLDKRYLSISIALNCEDSLIDVSLATLKPSH
jgi:hypothetical protein